MCDILGHEYGWTTDYVLNELTRPQIEAMLAAVKRRYELQAAAMKDGKDDGGSGGESRDVGIQFKEDMTRGQMAALGIEVK